MKRTSVKLFLLFVDVCFLFITSVSNSKAVSPLFEDNFNTMSNGSIPEKWIIDGPSGWNVQDGKYGINTDEVSNTTPRDESWSTEWKSIAFDVDVKWTSGQDKNIAFHYINSLDFYEIHYNDDNGGTIALERHIPPNSGAVVAPHIINHPLYNNTPYHFRIELTGNHIKIYENSNVIFDVDDNTQLPTVGGKIGLRAGQAEVWFDNVVVTDLSTSVTPPTTKVFLIPGVGASWNVDALINCKNSDYIGDWTLAPYIKDVYNPLILTALPEKGFTAIPFYYDWRQDVTKNAELLNNLINSSGLSTGEKVDIVGHSMGGLIGERYLQSQSGGKAAKFLAVGTPNQGSALAYPAVVNREVWFKNIGDRIGATLFIKHCGIPASLKNLLPTYNYLKDMGAKQPKDVGGMKIKNTLSSLLPLNFPSGFWGVKVGTLIGTGFPTLNIIDVTKDPHWPDGKPVREEYTNNGDGTVLAASAQIPGTDASNSITINQSHSGIIASSEGYSDILTFLGTPTTDDPGIYVDHKSALIIVGYPGSFTVTDENNNKTDSENGMVAIMDPADGNYQLQIDPTLTSTTFIVSQFLPNGQTEYKEYKFRGSNQEPKVIEYNSKHPNENPLHETREYKNPHFPKFWFYFWKFWNKLHR